MENLLNTRTYGVAGQVHPAALQGTSHALLTSSIPCSENMDLHMQYTHSDAAMSA